MSDALEAIKTADQTGPVQAGQVQVQAEETESGVQEASQVDGLDGFDKERALAKIRKQNQENQALRDRAKAAEEAAKTSDQLKTEFEQLQAENLRLQVGLELGLPSSLTRRLVGTTREELVADAEDLLKLVGSSKRVSQRPTEQLKAGLAGDESVEETDLKKLGERMFRR